ncbi:MAG: 50S ribosomal protein L10 [Thermoproteota archaeon]|jgi:large subunit ribosomal protein L10|nr:50S ribosomal protein L10 [Thermoproteota archaeon]
MSKYIAVKKTSRKRKEKIINELVGYLKNYKYFIIADLFKIKSADLQELRKIFYDSLKFKVVKNSLFRVALKKVYEENTVKKLEPYLHKQNIFIFSNANPYEIYLQLEKNKIKTAAKPGDVAEEDIIIPAGNTGITPGPVMSKFSKLKIPTKVEEGAITVTKDTVVVKKGDKISSEVVELLNLLGIKPISVTLKLKYGFDGKNIIENIYLDLNQIKKEIEKAQQYVLNLSLNAILPIKEIMPIIITQAHNNSIKVLQSLVIPDKEVLKYSIQRAISNAQNIFELLKSKGLS